VLHIHKANGISGSERHLLALLPALRARDIDVAMVGLTEEPGGAEFIDAFRSVGVDTRAVPAGPDLNPRAVTGIMRVINDVRPDIVHTHLVHADLHGLIAALVRRVPSVSSIHDPPPFFDRWQSRLVAQLAGRLARERIAISHDVERVIAAKHLGRPGHVTVIHYGIDPGPWQAVDRDTARARLNLTDQPDESVQSVDSVVVGIASRMVAGKGHDELLDAFELALPRAPNVKLVIAGRGPLQPHLEARASRLHPGSVTFLGFVDHMPDFVAACDIVTMPTTQDLSEGFGLVVLEAMAAGRPVIATAVGPVPEVVDDASGILVPAGSSTALADALVRLANDAELRKQMGAAGAARAHTVFALDRMVDHTITVYERVLAR
jgi:glycosyltransferase involved in cell wall biosynthesis